MGYKQLSLVVFLLHQLAFSSSHLCPKHQSISLLKFKNTFTLDLSLSYKYGKPSHPKTSSWNMSTDCCFWDGVKCDEMSGHVIELDLSCSLLHGVIDSNSSLFQLSHLQRLNLSWNSFYGSQISPKFGRFSSMTHLDLSVSDFSGQIPSEITHLSKLQSLHIFTFGVVELSLAAHDFKLLLRNLTQLRELDLSDVNISSTIPPIFSSHLTTLSLTSTRLYGIIPESIFHLPNLEKLHFNRNAQLSGYFPKIKWNSSASLIELGLANVIFSGNLLPESLGYLTSLQYLYLRNCNLRGPIPESLSNLTRIETLDLGGNSLNGTIPSWMFSAPSLSVLDLSYNQFSGKLEDFKSNSLVEIYLENNKLQGHLPKSIQNLVNLEFLDLSWNNFSGSVDVGLFSDLKHLKELVLSFNKLQGHLPKSIQNLVNLIVLGLSWNNFSGNVDVSLFSDLKHLSYLDLSYNSISLTNEKGVEFNWPKSLGSLYLAACEVKELEFLRSAKQLSYLDLSYNKLQGHLPKSIQNLVNLIVLDLSSNNFSGNVDVSLFSDLKQLWELDLSYNSISLTNEKGVEFNWPKSLDSLQLAKCEVKELEFLRSAKQLSSLDLSNNKIQGRIPDWASSNWNSLEHLNLSHNMLTSVDSIPLQSAQLIDLRSNFVNLIDLDLSWNNFSGSVDVSLFSDLKHLQILDLSYNSISLTNEKGVEFNWPESLNFLKLAACEVKELEFLRSAKQLSYLDLSYNKIQGRIPDWASSNWNSLRYLNLSHNMLTSVDSIPLQSPYINSIDLRSNFLKGSLPITANSTQYFFISKNNLSGEIPLSICNLTLLVMLDLARNNLTGVIPQCLGNMSDHLQVLDMHCNKLSGTLPKTFSNESSLTSLNLYGNKLQGEIPRSLENCKRLQVLDLGDNHLNDTFPMWLGTLPDLKVLSLRSNKLHGSIQPSRIEGTFPQLRIIDLSRNAFSGNLPTSLFQHLKAMRTIDPSMKAPSNIGYYQDSVVVVTKGLELEVVKILYLYTTIDLSNNKFEGHIPRVLGDLIELRVLNLAHNGLQGHIPSSLGKLSVVETLDLSFNQLSGKIPEQLASLTFLAFLKLSHNHLQGCIPQGNQFDTFGNDSYEGNDELRGFPISKGCGTDRVPETNYTVDEESNSEFLNDFWKAALMGYECGLCIGLSILYFMISTGNLKWFERITEEMEHKIMMGRRKKQQRQRNYRR